MSTIIKRFVTGPIATNTYVVSCNNGTACLVVDPSSSCDRVMEYIDEKKFKVEAIVLTHGHFDHVLGIGEIQARFDSAEVWVHGEEVPFLTHPELSGAVMMGLDYRYTGPVKELKEGRMELGGCGFDVLHVPGHSPGGCAFVFGNDCLSGDTLFAGSIGRTDFPGSDGELFLKSIRRKLCTLPDETAVWPGHGGRTTIGREKRLNPFLV